MSKQSVVDNFKILVGNLSLICASGLMKELEDISVKTIKVYGLKWRPVQTGQNVHIVSYLFLMGIVKLPGMVDYWSSSIFCSGTNVFNYKIMSSKIPFNLEML